MKHDEVITKSIAYIEKFVKHYKDLAQHERDMRLSADKQCEVLAKRVRVLELLLKSEKEKHPSTQYLFVPKDTELSDLSDVKLDRSIYA